MTGKFINRINKRLFDFGHRDGGSAFAYFPNHINSKSTSFKSSRSEAYDNNCFSKLFFEKR